MVERQLGILANLDEVAVGIAHITAPFPTVIIKRLGEEDGALGAPFFITGPDVGDTRVQETVHGVEILRGFENDPLAYRASGRLRN